MFCYNLLSCCEKDIWLYLTGVVVVEEFIPGFRLCLFCFFVNCRLLGPKRACCPINVYYSYMKINCKIEAAGSLIYACC